MVETGGAQIIETFSEKRLSQRAGYSGIRPGFVVDLCQTSPYGPNIGEYWDLSMQSDVNELQEVVDFEQPILLIGSPLCAISGLFRHGPKHEQSHRAVDQTSSSLTESIQRWCFVE